MKMTCSRVIDREVNDREFDVSLLVKSMIFEPGGTR
jgi:hypothetical protein